jgi:hypothetical protein
VVSVAPISAKARASTTHSIAEAGRFDYLGKTF